jgi:hypothetical protein
MTVLAKIISNISTADTQGNKKVSSVYRVKEVDNAECASRKTPTTHPGNLSNLQFIQRTAGRNVVACKHSQR